MTAPLKVLVTALLLILGVTSQSKHAEGASESATTMKQILDELFQQYDKTFRPHYGEKPTHVGVTAYILSVGSVDALNMEMTFTFYFRQSWDDPRLSFRSQAQSRGRAHHVRNAIVLDADRAKKIWRPDTFFVNEKASTLHGALMTNEFVRIQSNGTVTLSNRYTLKADCGMDLRHFPFDEQVCGLEIESFGTTMNDTIYFWANGEESLGISSDVSLPAVRVAGNRIHTFEISLRTGNYSRLKLELEFKRASGYYLIRFYTPMAIFVIVSLLTLLFANPFLEPLIHVINISFLILFSQLTWIQNLPMVSYLNPLYLYFFICIAHLLLSLFVSLAAAYRHLHRDDSVCSICKPLTELDNNYHRGVNDRRKLPTKSKSCNAGSVIFCFFKLLVIGGFIASNVFYWLFLRSLTSTANQKLLGVEDE